MSRFLSSFHFGNTDPYLSRVLSSFAFEIQKESYKKSMEENSHANLT